MVGLSNSGTDGDPLDQLETEIPRLRRFARYLTRDRDYADDLVQETLYKAVKNIGSWQPGTNLRAWLLVILKNTFRNDLRRNKREVPASDMIEGSLEVAVPGAQDARMALLEVQEAFLHLSEEHREVLLLVAVEGLHYEEAAVVLDVAVGTVRSRLSRARAALREIVETRNGKVEQIQPLLEQGGD